VFLRNYEGKTFEYPEPNVIEFRKARPMREERAVAKKVMA